jgi:hypothetical protein
MLKFAIITIGQFEGILCINVFNIELKHDSCIFGGLYIAITYNASRVLLLKSVVRNFNS